MTCVGGRRRWVWAVAMGLVAVAMVSCDDWGLYDRLDGDPVVVGELAIDPISATVHGGASVQFFASGGVPPYVFRVAEGGGSINAETGRFTAPETVGSSLVELRDTAGTAALAQVITVE